MRSARVYRVMTHVYPRPFRREYGEPMIQAFADRLRRDGRRRAWAAAVRDTTVNAPYEHWEHFMNGSPHTKLTIAAVVTATAAIVFLLLGGAMLGLGLLLVLAWQIVAISRVRGNQLAVRSWWKLSLSGVALFAVLFAIFAPPWPDSWRSAVPGELAWTVAMVGFSASIVLVAAGLLMGFAQWMGRRGGTAAA